MAYHVSCQLAHYPILPRHSVTHLSHRHHEPWGGQDLAYRTLGGFGVDNWVLCVLIIYTALSLQILSNLASDLGDGIHGTDKDRHHDSPTRLVGSGTVSASRFGRGLSFGLSKP